MANSNYQGRFGPIGANKASQTPDPRPRPDHNPERSGWFRWTLFLPSVLWGACAQITVLFANMYYELAKADYETAPQLIFIVLGSAVFGLLSYLAALALLFRALGDRPRLFSAVMGFFAGVAVISVM